MRAIGLGALVVALVVVLAPAPRAADEDAERPAIPDAQQTMEEVLAALEPVQGRIVKMDVKRRAAIVRFETEDQAAFDHVRSALEANAQLKGAARNPVRSVEVGAAKFQDGRWQRDFELRFREGSGPLAPATPSAHITHEAMDGYAVQAGLRQVYASRERADPNREAGRFLVTRRFDYEDASGDPALLTLAKLRTLCRVIATSGVHRVTEVAWQRATDPKDAPPDDDRIRKPRIEVATWQPLPAEPEAEDAPAAATEEAGPTLRDAHAVLRRVQGVLHGRPVRLVHFDVDGPLVKARMTAAAKDVLEDVTRALIAHPFFRGGGAEPPRQTGLGVVRAVDDRWRLDAFLKLDTGHWHGAPPRPSEHVERDFVARAATVAGLQLVHASREERDPVPSGRFAVIRQRLAFGPRGGGDAVLRLSQLEALLAFVSTSDAYAVTGITFTHAAGHPADAILKPQVEISAWTPVQK